jgi:hypothetical protein
LSVACGAHALHDGYTDLLYVMLPLWQVEFGIGYAALDLLRICLSGTMAAFQNPSALLSERIGLPMVLAVSRHSSADNWRFRMKFLIAIVAIVFFTSGAVYADGHVSRLEIRNAQIFAQNNSGREACRLGCNGNGACLRACDVTTCRQACGGDGTCLQSCAPSNCRLGCNGDGACLRGCAERDRGLGNR